MTLLDRHLDLDLAAGDIGDDLGVRATDGRHEGRARATAAANIVFKIIVLSQFVVTAFAIENMNCVIKIYLLEQFQSVGFGAFRAMTAHANYSLRDEIRDYWSDRAETFDQQVGHEIFSERERAAWHALIGKHLGRGEGRMLVDLACGTGVFRT